MNFRYFNPLEFEGVRHNAGLNAFTLSPTQWITATNAIGFVSQAGRYGGTCFFLLMSSRRYATMSLSSTKLIRRLCAKKNFLLITYFFVSLQNQLTIT